MCKYCPEKHNQTTVEPIRQIQVVRDFPNTSNHKTRITIPDSAEVWVSRDESPQIYMSVARQAIWFKWMGTGAWELLEEAPDCTRAVTERVLRAFIAGIYYDSDDQKLYSRDEDGKWKLFGADGENAWTSIQTHDGAFALVANLHKID